MRVIVAGATGFIGKELIKQLDKKGHEIVVLTRNVDSARFNIPVHCEVVTWSPELSSIPSSTLKGADAVINLAGEGIADGRWSNERKNKIIQSRVISTRQLIKAMTYMNDKPEVFVSASAIGFYGDRGDELLNESSSNGEGFLSQVCRSWEEEINKATALRIRTVALRIGRVLGHDGGALEKMLPPFQLGVGGKLGSGSQWMSWIHIEDLVNMMVYAVENSSVNGEYNAVSPTPVKNMEFTKTLGQVLKRPTIFPVPKIILKIALGELSELLLGSQKVDSKKICDTGFKFQFPGLEQALKEITGHTYHEIKIEQWVPQPLNKTFSFFKEAKNLEKITPEFLKFKVLNQSTPKIQGGTILNYRISLHGCPMKWQSKIKDWEPDHKFSDIQLKGPYSHWYHTHEFEEKKDGTLIKDHVLYKIPFGILGDLIVGKWIRKDLQLVFNHRAKVINNIMAQ